MVHDFLTHIVEVLKKHQAKKVIVAYSGGLDSHVLLHALSQVSSLGIEPTTECPLTLTAVHVNHHLSRHANAWAAHCQHVCDKLGITLDVLDVRVQEAGSLEQEARRSRYASWRSLVQDGDFLCLAHHADDQAETLLLQLMRGAGPKGLSAMPESSTIGAGRLLRPFLSVDRSILEEYAQQQGLKWIEDDSNLDRRFDRNFLRHEVIPTLKKRWPSMTTTLGRSARLCARQEAALLSYQEINESKILCKGKKENAIILRQWLAAQELPMPSEKKCQDMLNQMLTAKNDKNPCIGWSEFELRRYQNQLYVTRKDNFDHAQIIKWNVKVPVEISGVGEIHLDGDIENFLSKFQNITIRFRQGGEKWLMPFGHRPLKKCFQDWGVPPWWRNRIPLVFSQNKLIAILGYAVSVECGSVTFRLKNDMGNLDIPLFIEES